jgi:hypothetical protein
MNPTLCWHNLQNTVRTRVRAVQCLVHGGAIGFSLHNRDQTLTATLPAPCVVIGCYPRGQGNQYMKLKIHFQIEKRLNMSRIIYFFPLRFPRNGRAYKNLLQSLDNLSLAINLRSLRRVLKTFKNHFQLVGKGERL